MSVFSIDTVRLYADSIGLTNLSDEVLTLLCHDTEYRVREVIQEASKFMRHSNRAKLTTEDINYALRMKNVEPIYGYDPSDPVIFEHFAQGDLYYVMDKEIDFDTILTSPLPKVPPPVSFTSHWLAIEGVQPQVPENPIQKDTLAVSESTYAPKETPHPSASIPNVATNVSKTLQVKHHLSKEHQMYFDTITKCLLVKDATTHQTALKSLRSDAGIQQLVPYFVQFIAEMVMKHLRQLDILTLLVSTMDALLQNQYLFLEPYLHQIMPTLLTCVVGKRLCADPETEDHWSLREESSRLVATICRRFGDAYVSLQPRIMKTLLKALVHEPVEGEKADGTGVSLPSMYGALSCLCMLGKETVRDVIFPHFESIYNTIHDPASNNPKVFTEKCHMALLFSVKDVLQSSYIELIGSDKYNHDHAMSSLETKYPVIFKYIGKSSISDLMNPKNGGNGDVDMKVETQEASDTEQFTMVDQ